VLDWLVLACKLCELASASENREIRKRIGILLWHIQTEFTSDSQSATNILRLNGKFSDGDDFMDISRGHPRILEAEAFINDHTGAHR
jgi:hypothetical protein